MTSVEKAKVKRAKICISCKDNNEGFCMKHKEWCYKVNYICLGIKNPYEYIMPITVTKKRLKKTKKR